MEILLTLTDKDITGDDGLSSAPPRLAVRAVLIDRDGRAALIYSGRHNFYTLPGGGVEPGETMETALERELREETGCGCGILSELGCVAENRAKMDFTQRSYYYLARVVGEPGKPSLTQAELEEDTRLCWLPMHEATELLRSQPCDTYRKRFVRARDTAAVEKAMDFSVYYLKNNSQTEISYG